MTIDKIELGRRLLLKRIIGGAAATITLITLVPGMGMLLAPVWARARQKRARLIFSNPSDAPLNTTDYVPARYEGQSETDPGLFVRRMASGEIVALSARCTHAGCAVNWQSADNRFVCPCHRGVYNADGKNISGPPPRPLERLPVQTVDNQLYVEVSES